MSAIILRNSMPLMDSDTCPAEEPMVVSGFDIPTNSLEPNSQWLNRVKSCEIKSNHVKSTCLTPQISTQFSASSKTLHLQCDLFTFQTHHLHHNGSLLHVRSWIRHGVFPRRQCSGDRRISRKKTSCKDGVKWNDREITNE